MPWGKKVSEEICRQDVSREPSTGWRILVPLPSQVFPTANWFSIWHWRRKNNELTVINNISDLSKVCISRTYNFSLDNTSVPVHSYFLASNLYHEAYLHYHIGGRTSNLKTIEKRKTESYILIERDALMVSRNFGTSDKRNTSNASFVD